MYNTNQWKKQIRVDRRNLHQLIVDIIQDYLFRFTLSSIPSFLHPEPVSRTGWPHPTDTCSWQMSDRCSRDGFETLSKMQCGGGWLCLQAFHILFDSTTVVAVGSSAHSEPTRFCFVLLFFFIFNNFLTKIINHKTRNISEKTFSL